MARAHLRPLTAVVGGTAALALPLVQLGLRQVRRVHAPMHQRAGLLPHGAYLEGVAAALVVIMSEAVVGVRPMVAVVRVATCVELR